MAKVSFKGKRPGGGNGVYFLPGNYIVEVAAMKVIDKRKGGELFAIETIIHESSNPQRAPGSRCNDAINLSDDTMGILMGLVMGVNGLDPDMEVDDEAEEEILALYNDNVENNSAKGRFVEVEAFDGVIKSSGKDAVFTRWHPISDEQQAEYTKLYAGKKYTKPTAAPAASAPKAAAAPADDQFDDELPY